MADYHASLIQQMHEALARDDPLHTKLMNVFNLLLGALKDHPDDYDTNPDGLYMTVSQGWPRNDSEVPFIAAGLAVFIREVTALKHISAYFRHQLVFYFVQNFEQTYTPYYPNRPNNHADDLRHYVCYALAAFGAADAMEAYLELVDWLQVDSDGRAVDEEEGEDDEEGEEEGAKDGEEEDMPESSQAMDTQAEPQEDDEEDEEEEEEEEEEQDPFMFIDSLVFHRLGLHRRATIEDLSDEQQDAIVMLVEYPGISFERDPDLQSYFERVQRIYPHLGADNRMRRVLQLIAGRA